MRRIVAAGATDVGRVRESNEDAYLEGHSVFAVADGMGGHVAGEVASATALEPIEALDGRVFADATEAVAALRDAVVAANATVAELAENEPSYRGMGTTLTAVLLEGRRLHVAHVGDSRAYLWRDGRFSQLTDDHTLVQHLIDEGRLTREEAEQHPQRSIVTRAIGVSQEIEVDSMSLDLESGDQILLCSDGLTGVVADDEIAHQMRPDVDTDTVVHRLIDLANEAGGPDNITVLLLRYEVDEPGVAPPRPPAPLEAAGASGAGDAAPGTTTVPIRTRDERDSGDWARPLGNYGQLRKGGWPQPTQQHERRSVAAFLARVVAVLVGLAVLAGLLVLGGRLLVVQQYYVGVEGDEVVIFQGIDATVGPFELFEVAERTRVSLDEVQPYYRPRLEEGIPAADLNDARRIVAGAPRVAAADPDDEGAADPDDGPRTDPDGEGGADPGGVDEAGVP